jgi:hypothetical protein
MKAKEIVKRIREKLDTGVRENEAYTSEVSDDFERLQESNRTRKGGDAALLRLIREHNQKWNAVITEVNTWPEFQDQGRTWIAVDDFVRHIVSLTHEKCDPEMIEQEIKMFLTPQTISNLAVRQEQKRQREQEFENRLIRQFFGV